MTLRALLINNWRWKLFSLLIAWAVWFYIRNSISGDVGVLRVKSTGAASGDFVHEFPISVLTSPGDTNNYRLDPASVGVTVRGDFLLLQELDWSEFRVYVNLSHAPEIAVSAHVVSVTPPSGIQVVSIEPAAVLVRRSPANGTQPASLSQP